MLWFAAHLLLMAVLCTATPAPSQMQDCVYCSCRASTAWPDVYWHTNLQVEYQIEAAEWLAESGCDAGGLPSPEILLLTAAAAVLGMGAAGTDGMAQNAWCLCSSLSCTLADCAFCSLTSAPGACGCSNAVLYYPLASVTRVLQLIDGLMLCSM